MRRRVCGRFGERALRAMTIVIPAIPVNPVRAGDVDRRGVTLRESGNCNDPERAGVAKRTGVTPRRIGEEESAHCLEIGSPAVDGVCLVRTQHVHRLSALE